jgi:hypothetical protein
MDAKEDPMRVHRTSPRQKSRIAVMTCLALALGLLPAHIVAAQTTRYVDDDGMADATGGCDGDSDAPVSIQVAVDASEEGDTVVVCPGRYTEWLRFRAGDEGVIVRAAERWTATLAPPPAPDGGIPPRGLLSIRNTRDVRVSGLRIGPCGTGLESGFETVVHVQASTGIRIAGNRIQAAGCDGIDVIHGADVYLVRNRVREYGELGISLWGRRTDATAKGNRVRCGRADTKPVRCGLAFYVDSGALARLVGNRVYSVRSSVSAAGRMSLAQTGIQATGDSVVIRKNVLRGIIQGIIVEGDGILIGGNDVRDARRFGLWIPYAEGGIIRFNTLRRNGGAGIDVGQEGASDLNIHHNDAAGNAGTDCRDWTSGKKTSGTANTWRGNLGDESDPRGLCTPS